MERAAVPTGRPVVAKIGSSSLVGASGGIDRERLDGFVAQVEALRAAGHPVIVVTSAAIAAGLPVLGLGERPKDVASLQVAAAVGQGALMATYSAAFAAHGTVVAQVLLTKDVLANRGQYVHSRNALEQMLALGVVPIVNENDTVVVDELRWGDNDRLAAIVSHLAGAGMLVLLTDTPGLYSGDPTSNADVELLSAVRHTDGILDEVARGGVGRFGSGGVATKVAAARMAAWSGIPTVIGSSEEPDLLERVVSGEPVGTWIEPHESGLSARKLWIAFGLPAKGTLVVDQGAERAIVQGGKSLLAVGVVSATGSFEQGEAVEVESEDGRLLAKGVVRIGSEDLDLADGPLVHRDDLVVLTA
ncbi:MAG: glutamate 5-kinase [Acidimicrobiia bacterium]|nr:MAG: glutamate 5-kinase [Acidimicrobiia bacterium]